MTLTFVIIDIEHSGLPLKMCVLVYSSNVVIVFKFDSGIKSEKVRRS